MNVALADDAVSLHALGGLGEIGMNCMALSTETETVLIDCGVTFPTPRLGANLIHPSFESILESPKRLVGLVLTHGHEDHLGAVPYLLRERLIPVWGPPYALSLLRDKLEEHDLDAALTAISPGEPFSVGPFRFEAIRVTHSTADSTALVIDTPAGRIVHSGDFKIDEAPTDGEDFDRQRFEQLGHEGVRLLLSDSTNSFVEGSAGSESGIASALEKWVANFDQAVVVGVFASNVHRLRSLFEVADGTGRNVLALGRSVRRHIATSVDTGYLKNVDRLLVSPKEARELPRDRLLVIATGSQGEERAALGRLSRSSHPDFSFEEGDRVLLSARVIPGHETTVYDMINRLARRGIEVVFGRKAAGLHVSGHACRDEQAELIRLLQPDCFLPVHGTLVHMQEHGKLAQHLGVPEVQIVENGAALCLDRSSFRQTSTLPTGRVHVDTNFEAISPETLKARARLSEVGAATAVLSTEPSGAWSGRVRVVTHGALPDPNEEALLREAAQFVANALRQRNSGKGRASGFEDAAAGALGRFFRREFGWKPLCAGVLAP